MTATKVDTISPDQCRTLYGLFLERVRRSGPCCAYRDYHRGDETWVDVSWDQVGKEVARWQQALLAEGLKAGDRVALVLRNSREWVVFDQAAMGLGLVVVPLYTDDRPDNVAYVLEDSGTRLLLVQDAQHWRRLAPALDNHSALKVVLLGEPDTSLDDGRLRWASGWLPDEGGALLPDPCEPEALATVVYTSGTTGNPKGVMLSHRNILSVTHSGLQIVTIQTEDVFLSFLPLSHMFERTVGYYLPMMAGSTVAHARSVAQLGEDLATIRPSVLIAVPRVFERLEARIRQQLTKAPGYKRRLFEMAVAVGWQRFCHQQGRSAWGPRQLLWPLLQRLVAHPLMARLGGRLRLVVSGGAPLPESIARTFLGLGLPLLQGYGLTETSPQVSTNRPENNDPLSVGLPLPGIEVTVGEEDELLVRGPGVMLGYWNNPEATRMMITPDGWLHTGDQVRIEEGRIYITGRLKDILVLSNGEKVPPADMEMAILADPLFEQVMVFGEGRPFLSAVVVLNEEEWAFFAQRHGFDPAPDKLSDKRVVHAVLARIGDLLHRFPAYAKVRRVHLSLDVWSIENGLLTPTMKVKRKQVLDHYSGAVEALYERDAA
jgi:long-chain acyl-CoA synthetase